MSLDELKNFREDIVNLRHEYSLLELAMKTLGNAAYGASANKFFYFYNLALAGDITGECRHLTKTMWHNLEHFFHEELWENKDLQKQFNFELDESKHDWYREQPISIYSDTDSVYTTYGSLFEAMTETSKANFDTDKKKLDFILDFNKKFLDKQNTKWCHEIYDYRFANTIHEFELETVSKTGIYLKKKKYLKALMFSKGKYYDDPKVTGTGIEIIKSTTPKLCRVILTDLMHDLMFNYKTSDKTKYQLYFNQKLLKYRKDFYKASPEDISQSVSIGSYKKYVLNDETDLVLDKRCPVSVKSIALYNYLAHKNGLDNLKTYTGKIKYYNIKLGDSPKSESAFFGYPAGEYPSFAPKMDKITQWDKTVIEPINRFLKVMNIDTANASESMQLSLF